MTAKAPIPGNTEHLHDLNYITKYLTDHFNAIFFYLQTFNLIVMLTSTTLELMRR